MRIWLIITGLFFGFAFAGESFASPSEADQPHFVATDVHLVTGEAAADDCDGACLFCEGCCSCVHCHGVTSALPTDLAAEMRFETRQQRPQDRALNLIARTSGLYRPPRG